MYVSVVEDIPLTMINPKHPQCVLYKNKVADQGMA